VDRVIDERVWGEQLPEFHALDVGEYFEFDDNGYCAPAHLYQKTGDTTGKMWYLELDHEDVKNKLSCRDADLTPNRFHKVRRVYVEWTVRLSYEPLEEDSNG
jgi:hypothetical protein